MHAYMRMYSVIWMYFYREYNTYYYYYYCYSHSRQPDLPVTHFSLFSTWLSVLSFYPHPLKPRCQGRVMGFVGGGGIIAITTLVPHSVYCIVNIKQCMEFLLLVFYACLRLRFLDVETNPPPRRPVATVCRLLCIVICGALLGTLVT